MRFKSVQQTKQFRQRAHVLSVSSERIYMMFLRRKLCKRLVGTESDTCRFHSTPLPTDQPAARESSAVCVCVCVCVCERASCGCLVPPRRAVRAAVQTVAHRLYTSIIHYTAQFMSTGGV